MNIPSESPGPGHRRRLFWLGGVVTAILLPKCLACVAGYIALVIGLAATAPEICGGAPAGGGPDFSPTSK